MGRRLDAAHLSQLADDEAYAGTIEAWGGAAAVS